MYRARDLTLFNKSFSTANMNILILVSFIWVPMCLIMMALLAANTTFMVQEIDEEERLIESDSESEPDVIDYAMMGLLSV